MKARIKSNGKIVEVVSHFMPRKRNSPSRNWVCNLADGTCIDESQVEYIEEPMDGLDEAAEKYAGYDQDCEGAFYEPMIIQAFKAGAEWDRNQHKVLGETEIYLEDDGGEFPYTQEWIDIATNEFKIPDGFKPGDKIIVSIRKK